MSLAPHPLAQPRLGAGDTRAHLLETLLLALLAALLGRPRLRAAAWHPAPEPEQPATSLLAAPRRHWHADCESPILYVIGPGPNRGLRPIPRILPIPHPECARAPPRPGGGFAPDSPTPTHALNVP
jgi:hypothetical protein